MPETYFKTLSLILNDAEYPQLSLRFQGEWHFEKSVSTSTAHFKVDSLQ